VLFSILGFPEELSEAEAVGERSEKRVIEMGGYVRM
jgi:hypothetical protein